MRANMGIVASGQIPPVTSFDFDAKANATGSGGTPGASPLSWVHTPAGVPKGVLVLTSTETPPGDFAMTGVTYGGVALSQVTGSPVTDSVNAETHVIRGWFLGSGLPTGAQTINVSWTATGSPGSLNGVSFTVTGPNNSAVEDTTTVSGAVSGADPSVALTITADSFCAGLLISGRVTTSEVTPGAAMTQALEVDVGNVVLNAVYKTDIATSNTTLDWTALSEEYAALAVAIKST